MAGTPYSCPKCGLANPETAQFCVACHNILIHRCPKCWHEQRQGNVCEKCGANIALAYELAAERAMQEEDRLWWAQFWAAAAAFVQLLFVPFLGLGGLLRSLVARLVAVRLSNR